MQISKRKIIAYLAPEIPALSATFVYNEILGLEAAGIQVEPFSIRYPEVLASARETAGLRNRTNYVYGISKAKIFAAQLYFLTSHPARYVSTAFLAMRDAFMCGIFNRTGLGLLYRFALAAVVAKALVEKKCDHIHAHFAHVATDLAMYSAKLAGLTFSFTSHANDLFERGWLLREKVGRAAFAVTISEFNRQFLRDAGAASEKIHIVRCGVDPQSFTRKSLEPLSSPPIIGILGRMVEKKGFEVLIKAAALLSERQIPFRVELAGGGPLENAMRKLVADFGLQDLVRFRGAIPHDQVADWLKGLDLFVLPCVKDSHGDMDGIPVVLMEAMLSGVPVISTKLSGIPELIENHEEGLLVSPNNPEELSAAIELICRDQLLRNKCINSAINKVNKEFNQQSSIEKLRLLFGFHPLSILTKN